ncbi:MAG: phage integrase-like protein [Peptococcaceae bacterium]|nr:phage integrase-like protein [Peptococcaceae bacterium]
MVLAFLLNCIQNHVFRNPQGCTIHVEKSIALMDKGKIFEEGTKNDEDRIIDMPGWYMEEMKQYRKKWLKQKMLVMDKWEGADKEYIFHSGYGQPFYYTYPTEKWEQFCKKHNIRYISLHKLRHTSVTILIEKGAPMKAIQERAGHKQAQTTNDIYGHVTKKLSREVANMLDSLNPQKASK